MSGKQTILQVAGHIAAIVACVMMLGLASACSNGTESASSTATSVTSQSGTAEAVPVDKTEHYEALKNAKLGDKIDFSSYRYTVSNGQATYYIHGRYVIVSEDTVMQIRDEIEVPDAGMSIGDILALDPDFDIELAKAAADADEGGISFYSSDGTAVSGSLDDTLNSTVTDCVAEYIVWENDAHTVGQVQSYLFSYGYVPVKITGYYTVSDTDDDKGIADTSGSVTDNTGTGAETGADGTETDTSGSETGTDVASEASEATETSTENE